MCIFLWPAGSLGHFDPYVQAEMWLKEKEPGAQRVQSQMLSVSCGGWGWKRCPGGTRAARAGKWISGSHPSWNRAGDRWMMPPPNPNIGPSLPLLAARQGWQQWWHSCPLPAGRDGVPLPWVKGPWPHRRTFQPQSPLHFQHFLSGVALSSSGAGSVGLAADLLNCRIKMRYFILMRFHSTQNCTTFN